MGDRLIYLGDRLMKYSAQNLLKIQISYLSARQDLDLVGRKLVMQLAPLLDIQLEEKLREGSKAFSSARCPARTSSDDREFVEISVW